MSLDTFTCAHSNTAFPIVLEEPSGVPSDPLAHLKSDLEADLEQAIEALLASKNLATGQGSQEPVSVVSDFISDASFHVGSTTELSKERLATLRFAVSEEEEVFPEAPRLDRLSEPATALNARESRLHIRSRFDKAVVVRVGVFISIVLGVGILGLDTMRLLLRNPEVLPQRQSIISLMAPPPSPSPIPPAFPQVQQTTEPIRKSQQIAQPNADHEHVTSTQSESQEIRVTPKPLQQLDVIPNKVVTTKNEPQPPVPLTGAITFPGSADATAAGALGGLIGAAIPMPLPHPQERIRVGGQVAAAKLISHTVPKYPPVARQQFIQGTVQLEAVISKDGAVENLKVVTGNRLLNQAAMEAVKQWRYRPTLLNGVPVEVITTVDVNFRLGQ